MTPGYQIIIHSSESVVAIPRIVGRIFPSSAPRVDLTVLVAHVLRSSEYELKGAAPCLINIRSESQAGTVILEITSLHTALPQFSTCIATDFYLGKCGKFMPKSVLSP